MFATGWKQGRSELGLGVGPSARGTASAFARASAPAPPRPSSHAPPPLPLYPRALPRRRAQRNSVERSEAVSLPEDVIVLIPQWEVHDRAPTATGAAPPSALQSPTKLALPAAPAAPAAPAEPGSDEWKFDPNSGLFYQLSSSAYYDGKSGKYFKDGQWLDSLG